MAHLSRRRFINMSGLGALGLVAACSSPRFGALADADAGHAKHSASSVRYEFIRNATARLHYGGKIFLLDPMLSGKGLLPSFAGIAPNPTAELPISAESVLEDIDAVIVSHLHADHFDEAAADLLRKDIPMLTPHNSAFTDPGDPSERPFFKQRLEGMGFTNVQEIAGDGTGSTIFEGVKFHQVWGRHGKGQVGDLLGNVNGIVFETKGAPTIYWAGDTILNEDKMLAILNRFRPDIVIAHTGGPVIEAISPELLLMDVKQGIGLFEQADAINPNVKMVAVHMEALDHCFSTRADMKTAIGALPVDAQRRIFVPEDGASLVL